MNCTDGPAKIKRPPFWWSFYFVKTFHEGFEPGCTRVSTARQVPLENEVFMGDSPQDMHGEYADEQLTTIQKRICLIEILIMVGLLFVKEASSNPSVFPMFSRVRKLIVKNHHHFAYLRTIKKKRLEI